jgi:type I restriction enzyme S subunit
MEKQKNIPLLRFPEFTNEWDKKELEKIFSIFNGFAFSSSDATEEGALWVKIADVGILEMKKDSLSYLPTGYVQQYKKFLLKEGDYVVALTRPILNGRLKIAKVDNYFNDSLLNQRVGKLITADNPSFVYALLQKNELIKSIENNIAGSDPPNLSPSEINYITTFIPTLPEQTKIASFLTAVDDRLNQLKKKKSLLEQYKKGVMQKIFDQEIKFKDDEGKEFPEWDVANFGSLYSFKATNSFSRDNLNYESGEVKNIHYGDIHTKFKPLLDTANENIPYINNEMDISKIPNDNYCKAGDLVIADASEDYNDIGKAIEVYNLNNEKVVAGLHTILAKPDLSKIALGFGAYLMKAEYIHFQIRVISQGTKVLGLSSNRLSGISVKLPCVNEQTKIAIFLSAIDEKICLCNTQIVKTEEYKKGLLQQMFV